MTADLIAARKAAIARGDKALGREIYHQLVAQGYVPEQIDADTFAGAGDIVPAVDGAAAPEAPEVAVPADAPEQAVKPSPKRRAVKDDE